jgi:hypothetical protein
MFSVLYPPIKTVAWWFSRRDRRPLLVKGSREWVEALNRILEQRMELVWMVRVFQTPEGSHWSSEFISKGRRKALSSVQHSRQCKAPVGAKLLSMQKIASPRRSPWSAQGPRHPEKCKKEASKISRKGPEDRPKNPKTIRARQHTMRQGACGQHPRTVRAVWGPQDGGDAVGGRVHAERWLSACFRARVRGRRACLLAACCLLVLPSSLQIRSRPWRRCLGPARLSAGCG